MRRYLKKQINDIMDTMLEADEILQKALIANQIGVARTLVEDMKAGAEGIIGSCLENDDASIQYKNCMNSFIQILTKCLNAKKMADKISSCALLKNTLRSAREILNRDIANDKFKIVFMPYKADMWTSMASIWENAIADEECEVCVVPIPYYDITNPKNISLHYERERFPKEVECIHYNEYLEAEQYPDVIIIHNPYDDQNNMTRVPERFYSSVLRQHTNKLVYSPYHTFSSYVPERQLTMLITPANQNADLIICQSERMKKIYEEIGYPSEKILAYGSPKIDAVINSGITREDIPEEWKQKIGNKKVFLLNTHLSYFPTSSLNTGKTGDYAVRFHEEIAKAFLNRDDCALIWRPHPLLKNMLEGRFNQCLEYVNGFEQRVRSANNGIVDELGDYFYSFACSDALISTWSSLINEYMVTQKPVMIFQTRADEEVARNSPLNCNVNYFRFGPGYQTFESFRDNVINGIDSKYEMRMNEVEKAFSNLDGMAGKKIYDYLKNN